jgi:hypothetical protein
MENLITQLLTHTLVDHHVTGQLSSFLQVITGTSCNPLGAVHNFFGNTATQHAG